MIRAVLSLLLCACVVTVGIVTACLASSNRSRSSDLDADQRWCETFTRQNDLLRANIASEEWKLLNADLSDEDALDAAKGRERSAKGVEN